MITPDGQRKDSSSVIALGGMTHIQRRAFDYLDAAMYETESWSYT